MIMIIMIIIMIIIIMSIFTHDDNGKALSLLSALRIVEVRPGVEKEGTRCGVWDDDDDDDDDDVYDDDGDDDNDDNCGWSRSGPELKRREFDVVSGKNKDDEY